jgi:hypothetical protein
MGPNPGGNNCCYVGLLFHSDTLLFTLRSITVVYFTNIYWHALYNPILRGSGVSSTSLVRTSPMLVMPIIAN